MPREAKPNFHMGRGSITVVLLIEMAVESREWMQALGKYCTNCNQLLSTVHLPTAAGFGPMQRLYITKNYLKLKKKWKSIWVSRKEPGLADARAWRHPLNRSD